MKRLFIINRQFGQSINSLEFNSLEFDINPVIKDVE